MSAWKSVREMWQQSAPPVQALALLMGTVVFVTSGWLIRDIVANARRPVGTVVKGTSDSGEESKTGEQTPEPESAATEESTTESASIVSNDAAGDDGSAASQQPDERMVAESFVWELMKRIDDMERRHRKELADALERAEKRHREELASRDKRIDQLSETADELRDRLDELGREQVKLAWNQVEWFKQQTTLGNAGRSDLIRADERHGPEPRPQENKPVVQKVRPAVNDDPFGGTVERTTRMRRPTGRRLGFVNANPKRRVQSSGGYPPGSARRRLREAEARHRAAIGRTRIHQGQTGSSRVLSEMEAGGR